MTQQPDISGMRSWGQAVLDEAAAPGGYATNNLNWWKHAAIKCAEKGLVLAERWAWPWVTILNSEAVGASDGSPGVTVIDGQVIMSNRFIAYRGDVGWLARRLINRKARGKDWPRGALYGTGTAIVGLLGWWKYR
jgi:hypothetical protein